jgi:hypothetical protein
VSAVKNFYHDEICGAPLTASEAEALVKSLKENKGRFQLKRRGITQTFRFSVREELARKVGKSESVAEILGGLWDHTPAFRKLFGEMWLKKINAIRDAAIAMEAATAGETAKQGSTRSATARVRKDIAQTPSPNLSQGDTP